MRFLSLNLLVASVASCLAYGDTVLHENGFCTNKDCIIQASTLMKSRDLTTSPCTDFYSHACGHWAKHHSPPLGTTTYTTDSTDGFYNNKNRMEDRSFLEIERLLNVPISDKQSAAEIKAKFHYKACMNLDLIERRHKDPQISLMHKLGGWPVTMANWTDTKFETLRQLAKLNILGFQVLWKSSVQKDYFNQQRLMLTLEEPTLNIPRKYLLDKKYSLKITMYRRFIMSMSYLFGAKTPMKDTDDMVAFEIALANITSPVGKNTASNMQTYHRYSLASFRNKVSRRLNIETYYNYLRFESRLSPQHGIHFISYANPTYFYNLGILLENTPKRVLANYFILKTLLDMVPYLSHLDVGSTWRPFKKAMYGDDVPVKRSDHCTKRTAESMPFAVSRMYVDAHLGHSARAKAVSMVKHIVTALSNKISYIPWMSASTRHVAKNKLLNLVSHVGFSDELMDDAKLYKIYQPYVSMEALYYENEASVKEQHAREMFKKLGSTVKRNQWEIFPHEVKVVYDPAMNKISISAAALQAPLFKETFPSYLNFAGIGMQIANQLIHSIDETGRNYDGYGYHRGWWGKQDSRSFRSLSQCYIDQYSQFHVPQIKQMLEGFTAVADGMADSAAIDITFSAYKEYIRSLPKKEDMIPVVQATPEKLFFLNAAQGFCNRIDKVSVWFDLLKSKTTPDMFRVLGAFQNSAEFSKYFKCQSGSVMNPAKKCSILS